MSDKRYRKSIGGGNSKEFLVPDDMTAITCTHHDREVYAFGLCQSCYTIMWNKRNPEKYKQKLFRGVLRKYGLTPEDFQKLLDAQKGVCAICKQSTNGGSRS